MTPKRIVVLSGAGISAESGLKTFRGAGGLWEGHRVEDVATPQAWANDADLVLRFYNERRLQLKDVEPNEGHKALERLESKYSVHVVTQNVDDLHERAGSSNVLHLHGELTKVRSTVNESLVYDIRYKTIELGDECEQGSQLRPHIVWFGEDVPMIQEAAEIVSDADILIITGTSLAVYPAAGLIHYLKAAAKVYVVDPQIPSIPVALNVEKISDYASIGLPQLVDRLLKEQEQSE